MPASTESAGDASVAGRLRRRLEWRTARRYGPLASWLMLLPVGILFIALFLYPVIEMLGLSVFDPQFTTAHYRMVFAENLYFRVLWRTLQISIAVAGLCILLGYPVAYVMARSSGRTAALIGACILVPLWTSVLVRSYAWIVILQRNGLINEWLGSLGMIDRPLRLIYTDGAVIVTMAHVLLPFTVLPLYGSIKGIPDELLRAASIHGAGAMRVFRHVVLPLSLPGVAAGFALVFVQALGFFVTPALVGGPRSMMIATLIGKEIRDGTSWALAAALAGVLLVVALAVMFVFNRALDLEKVAGEGH